MSLSFSPMFCIFRLRPIRYSCLGGKACPIPCFWVRASKCYLLIYGAIYTLYYHCCCPSPTQRNTWKGWLWNSVCLSVHACVRVYVHGPVWTWHNIYLELLRQSHQLQFDWSFSMCRCALPHLFESRVGDGIFGYCHESGTILLLFSILSTIICLLSSCWQGVCQYQAFWSMAGHPNARVNGTPKLDSGQSLAINIFTSPLHLGLGAAGNPLP